MANETLKELQYDGKKIISEVARRDALGRTIDTTYATKNEIMLPPVKVCVTERDIQTTKFTATQRSPTFNPGNGGEPGVSSYFYFDASCLTIIPEGPISDENVYVVMFQAKRKHTSPGRQTASGYRFTHLSNGLINTGDLISSFWLESYEARFSDAVFDGATTDIVSTFKSEWRAKSGGRMGVVLGGNICILRRRKRKNSGLALIYNDVENDGQCFSNLTYDLTTTLQSYERIGFALCKIDPAISQYRPIVGPMTVLKASINKESQLSLRLL